MFIDLFEENVYQSSQHNLSLWGSIIEEILDEVQHTSRNFSDILGRDQTLSMPPPSRVYDKYGKKEYTNTKFL